MTIYDKITADIKSAMLSKNTVKRDCLRSLVSDIKNQSVNMGKSVTNGIVVSCVKRAVKQRSDSITQFKAASRFDLAVKEEEELGYLNGYLPKSMSADETRAAVDLILQSVEAVKKNMGLIMRQLPNTADKKAASQYLNGILR